MAEHSIENEELKILVSDHGGELVSLVKKETGQEYIWNADKAFWGRHAPVLFPIVGGLRENIYRFGGREYRLGQHGFARDMEPSLSYCLNLIVLIFSSLSYCFLFSHLYLIVLILLSFIFHLYLPF